MANAPDPKSTPAAIKRREETFEKFLTLVPDLDTDDLDKVWGALRARALVDVEWCWRIDCAGLGGDLDGLVVTEEDQSAVEVEKCCRMTGAAWNTLSPFKGIEHRNAIIAVALIERRGLTIEQATDALRKVTARALVKATTEYAVKSGPFEDGPPSP